MLQVTLALCRSSPVPLDLQAADCTQRAALSAACCHQISLQHRSVVRRRQEQPATRQNQLLTDRQPGLRHRVQARADPAEKAEQVKRGAENIQDDAKEQANNAMDEFEDSLDSKPASEVLGSLVGVHE